MIHSFAWNCSSCQRIGVPLAVDLEKIRKLAGQPLRVLSVTTPARREETLAFLADSELTHAVAMESPLRSESPYIDARNPLTYVHVIAATARSPGRAIRAPTPKRAPRP